MALDAGALVSWLAFELMDEAYKVGGFDAASLGLLLGAAVFFTADRIVSQRGGRHRKRSGDQQKDGSAVAIAIGALMDGIPESAAIGISMIGGGKISAALVAAVFLSNVPEGLSAAAGKQAGRSTTHILGIWGGVTVTSAVAALFGYLFLTGSSENLIAAIQAFAAGAILTMLASTMMPEAYEEGGEGVGLVTTVGFLLAFVLSRLE
jgi:zinc transporter, ZIP family